MRTLLALLLLAPAQPTEPPAVAVRWQAPLDLADDFKKQKACRGLSLIAPHTGGVEVGGLSPERGEYTIVIEQASAYANIWTVGTLTWTVADKEGKVLAMKERVRRGKVAVRNACEAIKKAIAEREK